MTDKTLFDPYILGSLKLSNRIVMAPLTRNRAGPGLVPSEYAAAYYSQRASAGLIITEATQISADAQGYQDTPGLYTQPQIDGWRKVTDAVHAKGGESSSSCGTWAASHTSTCALVAPRRWHPPPSVPRPRPSSTMVFTTSPSHVP